MIRNLSADAVVEQVGSHGDRLMLLEEYLPGSDYRVYVTAGQYIAAVVRLPANVVGTGRDTVQQLIEAKNAQRMEHPVYCHYPIPLNAHVEDYLRGEGLSLESVPGENQRVFLSDVTSVPYGGDVEDITESLPNAVREQAVQAQQALGLPNAGLDLIVSSAGTAQQRVVVLEANQTPYITLLSLPLNPATPSPGNRVAESIIDYYFPESVNNERRTQACFDFMRVCRMLESGLVSEIALPVLGEEWVHKRLKIPASCIEENTPSTVQQVMFRLGIHAQIWPTDRGDFLIDLVAPENQADRFVEILEGG